MRAADQPFTLERHQAPEPPPAKVARIAPRLAIDNTKGGAGGA